jgi:hypothetical protein
VRYSYCSIAAVAVDDFVPVAVEVVAVVVVAVDVVVQPHYSIVREK